MYKERSRVDFSIRLLVDTSKGLGAQDMNRMDETIRLLLPAILGNKFPLLSTYETSIDAELLDVKKENK
jgi:hypothetical protein